MMSFVVRKTGSILPSLAVGFTADRLADEFLKFSTDLAI